jgi:glycosyltransferase involved in cell wall biosynthesis
MISASPGRPQHLLLYEPRIEGHHLVYLRYIVEDLRQAGMQLTLALDQRPGAQDFIHEQLGSLLDGLRVIPARDQAGWRGGRGKAGAAAACLQLAGAQAAFLCSFDEIASHCLRRAAFGWMPPAVLRGVLGGIYFRPRFLRDGILSPNQLLKKWGFARLLRGGWFGQILLMDEYLHASLKASHPNAPAFFLPDPSPDFHGPAKAEARAEMRLPQNARVFLFYGGPYQRKGLDLAVAAMRNLPPESRAFLLCVGRQPADGALSRELARLAGSQRACQINRFVSRAEEELSFAACDAVLLPYRGHFGSSGVLSLAAAAGKPVIASDEELIGRRVREHRLGLLFPSGNAPELRQRIEQMANLPDEQLAQWSQAAKEYAPLCSREAFRCALLQSFARSLSDA